MIQVQVGEIQVGIVLINICEYVCVHVRACMCVFAFEEREKLSIFHAELGL